MDDRTLLERAAMAAGGYITYLSPDGYPWMGLVVDGVRQPYPVRWNPLTDDGDALRLAVKLGMILVIQDSGYVQAGVPGYQECCEYEWSTDATRRAITRAAAAMAKEEP